MTIQLWGINRKTDTRYPLHMVAAGDIKKRGGASINKFTSDYLAQTASNGPLDLDLTKLKKATIQVPGVYKFAKGERIDSFDVEVFKLPVTSYERADARFTLKKVRVESITKYGATAGKGEDNFSQVVFLLGAKPETYHTADYVKYMDRAAAAAE